MIYRVTKQVSFSAAHRLTKVPEGHPCSFVHGHNYTLEVTVEGEQLGPDGMLLDLKSLSEHLKELAATWDHGNLNDFFSNPTCEKMAERIFDGLQWRYAPARLARVRVSEGPTSWVEVEP